MFWAGGQVGVGRCARFCRMQAGGYAGIWAAVHMMGWLVLLLLVLVHKAAP